MTTDLEVSDFLEHFGIRGQRWGVRKTNRIDKKSAKLVAEADELLTRANRLDRKSDRISARRERGGYSVSTKILANAAAVATIYVGSVFVRKKLEKVGRTIANQVLKTKSPYY